MQTKERLFCRVPGSFNFRVAKAEIHTGLCGYFHLVPNHESPVSGTGKAISFKPPSNPL